MSSDFLPKLAELIADTDAKIPRLEKAQKKVADATSQYLPPRVGLPEELIKAHFPAIRSARRSLELAKSAHTKAVSRVRDFVQEEVCKVVGRTNVFVVFFEKGARFRVTAEYYAKPRAQVRLSIDPLHSMSVSCDEDTQPLPSLDKLLEVGLALADAAEERIVQARTSTPVTLTSICEQLERLRHLQLAIHVVRDGFGGRNLRSAIIASEGRPVQEVTPKSDGSVCVTCHTRRDGVWDSTVVNVAVSDLADTLLRNLENNKA